MTERGIGDLGHAIAAVLEPHMAAHRVVAQMAAQRLAEEVVRDPEVKRVLDAQAERRAHEWVDELQLDEDSYDEGWRDGFREGHDEGYDEGRDSAARQMLEAGYVLPTE